VTRQTSTSGRLAWIDQLRTLAIVLVVNMHACVTYSHVGSWYVLESPAPPLLTKVLFVFWQGHLQAFFMGILFLVAGYFAHGSLVRRGPGGFVRERLMRLGAPTLFYMLVLNPVILLLINPNRDDYGPLPGAYAAYLASGRFVGGSGPMWFAAALLIFSAVLAASRALRPASEAEPAGAPPAPGAAAVAAWGLALVAATFLTRTVEPVDSSVLNMQLCYFPQYVLAFGTGVAAARGRWLQALARSALARRAGWAALILGPVALALVLVEMGVLRGAISRDFAGGWNPTALAFAAWEQLAGLGLGLGALAFCSGKLDVSTTLSRWLSERSFGVYLFHPPILILIGIAMRPLAADPFFKVSLLTAACLVASYLVSDIARTIPGLRALV
jgi:peptidoglycan/LPS O-acetylase OafA/YrhL